MNICGAAFRRDLDLWALFLSRAASKKHDLRLRNLYLSLTVPSRAEIIKKSHLASTIVSQHMARRVEGAVKLTLPQDNSALASPKVTSARNWTRSCIVQRLSYVTFAGHGTSRSPSRGDTNAAV